MAVDTVKLDVKIYLEDPEEVAAEELIPVFHRWIQTASLDELLIDVVDYSHVHHGPGVILVAHDAQYSLDGAGGRRGLLYSRRRETHAARQGISGLPSRLCSVLHDALVACQLLEREPALAGRMRFRGDELALRVNDGLVANTVETFDELAAGLKPIAKGLYGTSPVAVQRGPETGGRLEATVRASESPPVSTLLARLAENPALTRGVPS